MVKKGTKKKAAKTAARKLSKKKTTITFGCDKTHTCVASTGHDTQIGDTGSTVTMKAKSETVTIQYLDPITGDPARSPFDWPEGTDPIVITKKGGPQTFKVRADAQHHNPYKLTCENPDCFGLQGPPEMIVP